MWASAAFLSSFGGLVRLAMLTGFRRSELSGLKWTDVGNDRIRIAPERAKTGQLHEVPLTPAMRAVLNAQPRTTTPLVFPGRRNARLSGWSQLIGKARAASNVAFGLHDLRKYCRTAMSRLGVSEEIAELAIGHKRPGLIGVYNKDTSWLERVVAFERVSAHVAAIIGSSNEPGVVALPTRASTS